ncbi:MAG: hypothetical protein IJA63_10755 [Akkermansia sp.]|nr:hypothetical protein [Akkermansia sp.]
MLLALSSHGFESLLIHILLLLGVGGIGFTWWLWKNKRIYRSFKRALETQDAPALEDLLRVHHKDLSNKENDALVSVFEYMIQHDSKWAFKVFFKHMEAATWQQFYVSDIEIFGPLSEAIRCENADVLTMFLQYGMTAEVEPVSPWLTAISEGNVAAARILDEYGASGVTEEQQTNAPSIAEILDDEAWESRPERFIALVEYLSGRGIPVPEAASLCAELFRENLSHAGDDRKHHDIS